LPILEEAFNLFKEISGRKDDADKKVKEIEQRKKEMIEKR
jgi:hypothetical protein